MRSWEIRLANQPPLRVDVEDQRNLAAEYAEFVETVTPRSWKFWRQPSNPYWKISPEVVLHHEIVAGVSPKRGLPVKERIGFHHERPA